MHWQLSRFDLEDDARQLMLFRSNRDAGLLPLPFFAVALFV
jgi:4-hydroxybenzoate polyprenyltransferase